MPKKRSAMDSVNMTTYMSMLGCRSEDGTNVYTHPKFKQTFDMTDVPSSEILVKLEEIFNEATQRSKGTTD